MGIVAAAVSLQFLALLLLFCGERRALVNDLCIHCA